ncbi:MAG: hypothetical protein LR015_03370 [Verrucomicrobia bacterium]|nr:hypothetical protein [Verrucomicrobiota bacterium]
MKRSTELIQKFRQKKTREGKIGEKSAVGAGLSSPELPFAFSTFPCAATKSLDFARKAHALRDFSKCLLVIGPNGSDFLALASDFAEWRGAGGGTLVFQPESFQPETIHAQIESMLDDQIQQITIMLLQAESLSEDARQVLYRLAAKSDEFDRWKRYDIRFIVCLERDLDTLYDEGVIDESFYIFLGSRELTMPALNDIPEDIPLLASRYLLLVNPDLKLDYSTHSFLMRRQWPGNATELRAIIEQAAENCTDDDVVSARHFQQGQRSQPAKSVESGEDNPLQAHLRSLRDDYIRATLMLCNNDIERAAHILQCQPAIVAPFATP